MKSVAAAVVLVALAVAGAVGSAHGAAWRSAPSYPNCDECVTIVNDIGLVLQANITVDVIGLVVEKLCVEKSGFGWCTGDAACTQLCTGLIHEYGNEVMEIAAMRVFNGPMLCGALNVCPPVNGTAPSFNHTIVYQNLSMSNDHPPPAGSGKFLQLSDLHVDLEYVEGTNALCGEPVCCRAVYGPGANESASAGKYGAYPCDTPMELLHNLQKKLQTMETPDFIIFTGDGPPHDVWEQSRSENLNASEVLAQWLSETFPKSLVFPTLGNHESYPVNQFRGPGYDAWLYDTLANLWSRWLPESALETFRYGGYYTALAAPGLRIVSLNANYYLPDNYWLFAQNQTGADVGGQLAWLDYILMQASERQEQVYIIGHGPPGISDSVDAYAVKFANIIQTYSTAVAGMFFGHTHEDHYEVMYGPAPSNYPEVVMYIEPSITPETDRNPSFRVYEYNPQSGEVLNYDQYRMNLTEANLGNPQWNIAYSALSEYNMTDMSAASWDHLAMRMLVPDIHGNYSLACLFLQNKNSGLYTGPCTADVALQTSCEVRSYHPSMTSECVKSAPADLLQAANFENEFKFWLQHHRRITC